MFEDMEIDEQILQKYKKKRLLELKHSIPIKLLTSRDALFARILTERCIVHFFKPEFARCKVMDQKLVEVSTILTNIKFYRVEAENFKDVCEYLKITMLPFLGFFKEGRCVDNILGFEGLGEDDFKVNDLVKYIKRSDIGA